MCDAYIEKKNSKNVSTDQSCSLIVERSLLNAQVLQPKTAMDIDTTNSNSVKHETERQGSPSVSLQATGRWLREVVVDTAFSMKSLEPNQLYTVKDTRIFENVEKDAHGMPTLLYHTAIPTLTFEAYQQAEHKDGGKIKKEGRDGSVATPSSPQHPTTSPYYCELCNRKFTRQSNLTEHMLRHTGKVYTCDICHKKFTCLRYLTRHSRIHNAEPNVRKTEHITRIPAKNSEKSYMCNFCNKKFSCKSHLVAHTRIHTGEKPFSCEVCQKMFNHKSHLTAHTRIHTGEKPFHCRICQKQFRDPSNLAGHMRVHNGQKPFACLVCQEQFTHRSHLKKHEKTHASERPFCCSHCGKQCADNSKLKIHMKTHANNKTLTCSFCHNNFECKKRQEKQIACDDCTKEFAQRMQCRTERPDDRSFMIYAVGEQ